jgi:hypothetical protein
MRIFLLVIILILGFSGTEALPARAQSSPSTQPIASIALSPGTYTGTFQFDQRWLYSEITVSNTPPFTYKANDNIDLDVSGTVEITITDSQEGTIKLIPTRYIMYLIRDFSTTGAGADCKMTGYIEANAKIVFPEVSGNAYDSLTKSFKSHVSVLHWSTIIFKNIVDSTIPACTNRLNQKLLTDELKTFFFVINKKDQLHFYVKFSLFSAVWGVVGRPGYDKSGKVPGGWWESKASGIWSAYKEPSKPKGWKK